MHKIELLITNRVQHEYLIIRNELVGNAILASVHQDILRTCDITDVSIPLVYTFSLSIRTA